MCSYSTYWNCDWRVFWKAEEKKWRSASFSLFWEGVLLAINKLFFINNIYERKRYILNMEFSSKNQMFVLENSAVVGDWTESIYRFDINSTHKHIYTSSNWFRIEFWNSLSISENNPKVPCNARYSCVPRKPIFIAYFDLFYYYLLLEMFNVISLFMDLFFSNIESGTQKMTIACTCYLNMLLAVNCLPISEISESLVIAQVSVLHHSNHLLFFNGLSV